MSDGSTCLQLVRRKLVYVLFWRHFSSNRFASSFACDNLKVFVCEGGAEISVDDEQTSLYGSGKEYEKNGNNFDSGKKRWRPIAQKRINKINFTLEHPLNPCRATSSTLLLNKKQKYASERKQRQKWTPLENIFFLRFFLSNCSVSMCATAIHTCEYMRMSARNVKFCNYAIHFSWSIM